MNKIPRHPFECRLCLDITDDPSENFPHLLCTTCTQRERSRIDSNNKKRRIMRHRNGEKIRIHDWIDCLHKHNFSCAACKRKGRKYITLDHIVPIGSGGSNTHHNIQPLCIKCHAHKDGNTQVTFIKKMKKWYNRYKRKAKFLLVGFFDFFQN